ncbi:putative zinc-binding protein [Methanoplanus endosymbiosus]|uniref:Zinc-binding protein n=1 Tax=Methanoplanus endosymbiosus TaxID=33865 RepID=A0A9E7PMX4_9EURY|nr:putative zinc-binding protein [Methanoplanus endosymbiosus]UUX93198.1 putative zinc-binding protein [Methanoplanus endosymbiosus]
MADKILVTCSGISITGKLTEQAAKAFMQRNPGVFEGHISASGLSDGGVGLFPDGVSVVVFDGCSDCCSCKRLKPLGVEPALHITATDFGIEKRGMDEPTFWEIDILSSELRKAVRRL